MNSNRASAGFKPGPGGHVRTAPGDNNGNGETEEPIFGPEQKYALVIVRLMLGRKVSPASRKALPHHWGNLAEFIEASEGYEPEPLWHHVRNKYLASLKSRYPEEAKLLLDALVVTWKQAREQDPGDEEEEAGEPDDFENLRERKSFLEDIKGAIEFNRTEYRLAWLVKRILVAGQPAVVGAPKKSMKTSIMVALAVALASGWPFLGTFDIPERVPVLLLSGESGGFTLQETIRRVCDSKGVDVESLEGHLFIGGQLPQLGCEQDLKDLALFIREKGIKVVIIDPLYLCLLQGVPGRRLDPSNLFDVGPLLLAISRACLSAGAAPVLVHHFKKNGGEPHDLPELEELAYAGIQEFARQWILLKRRKRFEPGSGTHHLWLTVGGSAGHSGDWGVDIDEGVMDDDFQGRRWGVTVKAASDIRKDESEQKEASKAEQTAEKVRQTDEAKEKRARDDAVTALRRLEELVRKLERPLSKREWRDALHGWNTERFGPAFSFLVENNMIEWVSSKKVDARGHNRKFDGYQPTQTVSGTDRDMSGTDPKNPAQIRDRSEWDGRGALSPVGGEPPSESHTEPGSHSTFEVQAEGASQTHKNPAKRKASDRGAKP